MTTHTKCKCKVMFAQCSGNSVISSCTVCITSLNSEDVPTMRSISISQILALPDITDVKVLSVSQFLLSPRQFPVFTTVSPTLQTFSTTLIAPPTVIISDPTESRPRSRPWRRIFSPRIVLNVFLERIYCFCCFSYIA